MSDDTFDPLADLGLEGVGTDTAATETEAVTADEGAAPKQKREHIKLGAIVLSEDEDLPDLVRNLTGPVNRESKYKFDELAAPRTKEDGKIGYSAFFVELPEGVDEDKLKRSVQSAASAENRKYAIKDAEGKTTGYEKYFVTRSIVVEGVFKGTKVFRTDKPE